jgi:hypothetical protein
VGYFKVKQGRASSFKTGLTKHGNFHNKHVKEVTWGDDKRNTFRKFSRVFSCNNKNETNKIAYSL